MIGEAKEADCCIIRTGFGQKARKYTWSGVALCRHKLYMLICELCMCSQEGGACRKDRLRGALDAG